jgi:hypothetical protein
LHPRINGLHPRINGLHPRINGLHPRINAQAGEIWDLTPPVLTIIAERGEVTSLGDHGSAPRAATRSRRRDGAAITGIRSAR